MGTKRRNKSKRSLSSLPKGLVHRKGKTADPGNPFEISGRQKRVKPKHLVHNRPVSKPKTTKHALESLQRRQTQLRSSIKSTKKANVFVDRRIGQYDPTMSRDDQMLARLVRERTRQSQRTSKFRLEGDNENGESFILTHKGSRLDPNKSEAIYSDDEDDYGNLEAVDTELHFGGSGLASKQADPYGGSSNADLSQIYGQRKTELDDMIARRKVQKAERMQVKEAQIDTVEQMDEDFADLSQLLSFRKDQKIKNPTKPTKEDQEMKQWNIEMKEMMMKPKHKATDRTKSPEEIAKEEADRLHELESRRMARMNGDFEEDDFSDISVSDYEKKNRKSKKNKNKDNSRLQRNPDELSDSDDDLDDKSVEARFTADGNQYLDKKSRSVQHKKDDLDSDSAEESLQSSGETGDGVHPLPEGARVQGNYHAVEQFDSQEAWYDGTIKRVHKQSDGTAKYDIDYDDGDFEENMISENVRPVGKTQEEKTQIRGKTEEELELQFKRNKAKRKARNEIPFVFEAATTLDGLHEVIAKYASTGKDASMIIQRMHKANSVRLDHRNSEKMQNFYDVLLRRFVCVGDAIYSSGDGGEELGRFDQLNNLTKVMYRIAQDSPESAGAVWCRRIGFFQNAHAKRLRDAEFMYEEDEDGDVTSAWPSMGTFLLLRALGHIFPITDKRHYVTTPAILLLGQMVAQTPVRSSYDLVMGILCSGLLLEYTKVAKRVAPEALSFLAGIVRLFSGNSGHYAVPSLEAAHDLPSVKLLRDQISDGALGDDNITRLQLDRDFIVEGDSKDLSTAILFSALDLIEKCAKALEGSFIVSAESELFYEVSESILCLPKKGLSQGIQKKIASTASILAYICPSSKVPLRRRARSSKVETAIKSLAPRMEDPGRYSLSKDKGKKAVQAAIDRTRREYKREHKAISRELRLDAAFIEKERRDEHNRTESKARAKRQKNFAWLEGEQASMNQQVREGGGLLKGGGMGLARAKAATGKMGIKKGGKF